ncbi:MAG TPA: hypothetical protein VKI44_15330 [Acetobacteraceae bacterium]|nr:hypothetical protein [Acetobacteraceae bacterium]
MIHRSVETDDVLGMAAMALFLEGEDTVPVHPSFVASSYKACVKVPTLVSGSPSAGPYAYSRFASSCITSIASRAPSPALVYSSICRAPVELPTEAYGRRPIIM